MFLGMACFVIASGRLGDCFGHRKTFVWGTLCFTGASLMASMAPTINFLIAARALQGIASVCITVSSPNVVMATSAKAKQGTTVGIVMSIASIFTVIGPFIGGLFVQFLSWRLIFMLNLPLSAVTLSCLYIGSTKTDSSAPSSKDSTWDWLGFLLSICFLLSLNIALMEYSNELKTYILLSISLTSVVSFYYVETRHHNPMFDFELMKDIKLVAYRLILFFFQAIFLSSTFFSIYLQNYLGFTPMLAGALATPFGLLIALSAPLSGKIYDFYGVRMPLFLGLIILFIGFWQTIFLLPSFPLWALLFANACLSISLFLITGSIRAYVLQGAPAHNKGLASAILSSSRQIGGTIGISLFTLLQTYGMNSARLTGETVRHSYFYGFRLALTLSAALSAIAILIYIFVEIYSHFFEPIETS